jgi:membrane-bound inhibitor of C-type lysozyme
MLLLSACADFGKGSAAQVGRHVRYACDDGTALSVRFSADGSEAMGEFAGGPVVLPRKVTASGFAYETPQHRLRGKGDEAIWTVGRRAPIRCQTIGE